MSYAKDGRYMPGDEAPEDEKLRKERRNNVEFYHTECLYSTTTFRSYKVLAVRPLQEFQYGEEIFVGYGNNYELI